MEEKDTKNKFMKGAVAGALLMALVGLVTVGLAAGIWTVGQGLSLESKVQIEASTPEGSGSEDVIAEKPDSVKAEKVDLSEVVPKLNYIQGLIDEYYLFDEEVEREDPLAAIYSGYVDSLQDPYSVYYEPKDFETLMESSEGEYCGIGVMVSQNVYTTVITTVKVFKDTPAERAGMLPGDILTGVDGTSVEGMDLSLVVSDYIKGEEGTEVVVTVYRPSIQDYVDMTMTRAVVQNPTVEYEMLEGDIGYILLTSFEEVSTDQFVKAYDDLEAQGMKSLILDLRNNGGGVLTAAKGIADYLLPDGMTMVSFKGKGVEDTLYKAEDGHEVDVPMVVLANGESASASEVLVGALKDNHMAAFVGTNTFGKGIAQGIFDLPDGSAVKLTTAYYYVPSGECIHKTGIAPDVEVELEEELRNLVEVPKEEDNQLKAAIDVLREGEEAVRQRLEAEKAAAEAEAVSESDATESNAADSDVDAEPGTEEQPEETEN